MIYRTLAICSIQICLLFACTSVHAQIDSSRFEWFRPMPDNFHNLYTVPVGSSNLLAMWDRSLGYIATHTCIMDPEGDFVLEATPLHSLAGRTIDRAYSDDHKGVLVSREDCANSYYINGGALQYHNSLSTMRLDSTGNVLWDIEIETAEDSVFKSISTPQIYDNKAYWISGRERHNPDYWPLLKSNNLIIQDLTTGEFSTQSLQRLRLGTFDVSSRGVFLSGTANHLSDSSYAAIAAFSLDGDSLWIKEVEHLASKMLCLDEYLFQVRRSNGILLSSRFDYSGTFVDEELLGPDISYSYSLTKRTENTFFLLTTRPLQVWSFNLEGENIGYLPLLNNADHERGIFIAPDLLVTVSSDDSSATAFRINQYCELTDSLALPSQAFDPNAAGLGNGHRTDRGYLYCQNQNNLSSYDRGLFFHLLDDSLTSIEAPYQPETWALQAYPNPFNGTVRISSNSIHPVTKVQIYNMLGQLVVSHDYGAFGHNSKDLTFDFSPYSTGTYTVFAETATEVRSLQILHIK